ncbi:MAG TPA: hypothetical protein VFN09_13110 [Rhodanobacteraceae bacterium]|nr:hypothetical protein [Rhodanobacteraceae bacterium]
MGQIGIRISISVFASIVAVFLSWPYWRDFAYWPESRLAWCVYFGLGFVLSVVVFYMFMRSLHTLFEHDALERANDNDANPGENQP